MRKLLYAILTICFIPLSYFSMAYLFTFFPKKIEHLLVQQRNVYVLYSDIHTDIVFNIQEINLSIFPEFKTKESGYLAFGWGDKETYLNTPNISNIKISTSLKALFLNTPSLMHVSYINDIFKYKSIKKIKLTETQSNHLHTSIMQSFTPNKKAYKGYGDEDFFYTAKGSYNLINTCNTWTGDKLRRSNISMPYWTPFSHSIISALP